MGSAREKRKGQDESQESEHQAEQPAAGGDHAAAGTAAVKRIAGGGVKDLGHLAKPGAVLGNKLESLAPGQTLRFTTSVNQIWGLGQPVIKGGKGLSFVGKELAPNKKGDLGGESQQEYSFTLAADAKTGEKFTVSFPGEYQVQGDPDWHFAFHIAAG